MSDASEANRNEVFLVGDRESGITIGGVEIPLFVNYSVPLAVAAPLFLLAVVAVAGVLLTIRAVRQGNRRAAIAAGAFAAWTFSVAVLMWSIIDTWEVGDSGAAEADSLTILVLFAVWMVGTIGGWFTLSYFRRDRRSM